MIIITAIRSQISDTTVVISHEMKDIARSKIYIKIENNKTEKLGFR